MVARLRRRLHARPAGDIVAPVKVPRAAVAIVLRNGPGGAEILLIKRAERDDDPWSGHVALPGGREDATDVSLEATAIRETWEETGLDLRRDGEILGALDDLQPISMPRAVIVRPFVTLTRATAPLVLSDEVAEAFWVPLETLSGAEAAVESIVVIRGIERRVASFTFRDYVIWGMTERILRQLLAALAEPSFP